VNATLAEELLLVALDPERRAPAATTRAGLAHGLAGGLLLDLLLRGAGEVPGRVLLARPGRVTGDELLDGVLARVCASRPHSVEGWIRILARPAGSLRMRLVHRLVQARVLREETSRVLGVVPVRRYAVDDQAALKELRTRLRSALLGDGALDPRTASLVALVDACGLVDGLVAAPQRRGARRRAAQLTDRDPAAASVTAAIRRAQVHIVAGAAAAAVTSTTPTS
jgi:hypothetical protein